MSINYVCFHRKIRKNIFFYEKKKIALSGAVGSPELQIRRSKGYFSTEFLKISIEIEAEG